MNFDDLELYGASVLGTWRELGLPKLADRPWFFSQRTERRPAFLAGADVRNADENGEWLIGADGQDRHGEILTRPSPAAVLGTSIALLKACDEMPPLTLPEGSWIFETGGSKGLRESFTPAEVRTRLSAHFGVPASRILNEYGMTELFSQFYKWGDGRNPQRARRGQPSASAMSTPAESRTPGKPAIWKSSISRISKPSGHPHPGSRGRGRRKGIHPYRP